MTYRLWWTVGYVCTTEQEFKAAKHRLLPAAYEALDDALRRANQVFRAGGVAWLIEATTRPASIAAPSNSDAPPNAATELAVQPVGRSRHWSPLRVTDDRVHPTR